MEIINFPEKEIAEIMKRFNSGKKVFTVRVLDELNKYKAGENLLTNWGDKLKVVNLMKAKSFEAFKKKYKYFSELEERHPEQMRALEKTNEFDIIELKKISSFFRRHKTKYGTLILGGKSDENNEELIKIAESDEIVLHTEKPGSPFVLIRGKPKVGDVKEAAIFCAKYSQDYRDNKSDVIVHQFFGRDIKKENGMKIGTFRVSSFKKIRIKKEDILELK